MLSLWTIIIPFFITIAFFLYITKKLLTILKMPRGIREYKRFKNLFKLSIAILISISASWLLVEIIRTYIDMSACYLNNQMDQEASKVLYLIFMIPLGFLLAVYLKILFNICKLSIIETPDKISKYKKAKNIIKSICAIIQNLVILILISFMFYKLFISYLNMALTILG